MKELKSERSLPLFGFHLVDNIQPAADLYKGMSIDVYMLFRGESTGCVCPPSQ